MTSHIAPSPSPRHPAISAARGTAIPPTTDHQKPTRFTRRRTTAVLTLQCPTAPQPTNVAVQQLLHAAGTEAIVYDDDTGETLMRGTADAMRRSLLSLTNAFTDTGVGHWASSLRLASTASLSR